MDFQLTLVFSLASLPFPPAFPLSLKKKTPGWGVGVVGWVGRGREMTAGGPGGQNLGVSWLLLLPPSSLSPGFPDALEFLPFGDARTPPLPPANLQGLGFFLLLFAVSFTVPPTAFHFLSPSQKLSQVVHLTFFPCLESLSEADSNTGSAWLEPCLFLCV